MAIAKTSVWTECGNKPVGMEDKQLLRTFMADSATAAGVGISSQAEEEKGKKDK